MPHRAPRLLFILRRRAAVLATAPFPPHLPFLFHSPSPSIFFSLAFYSHPTPPHPKMSQVRLMLWAHPRSRSTALERAFIERGDCVVLHEPFSKARYHGTDASALASAVSSSALSPSSPSPLLSDVVFAPSGAKHAVVKDMPSHAAYSDTFLATFTHHIFLVRDPADSVRSYYKVDPGFGDDEAGYDEMLALVKRVSAAGAAVRVLESDVFSVSAEEVLRDVCGFLGLDWVERMVRWETRKAMPAWGMWSKFHKTALASTTIKAGSGERAPLPEEKERLVKRLTPVYESILEIVLDGERQCGVEVLPASVGKISV